jgi:flagellar basal body-associated protein FliL
MIKPLLLGLWISVVVGASSYVVADMKASAIAPAGDEEEPYLAGLEYKSLPPLTVPMISSGAVGGYLVAKLTYTADARTLHELPIEPEAFVADEAFRTFYTDGRVEFGKVARQNLEEIAGVIRDRVNERLGAELVKDVLIEQVDYVDRSQIGKATGESAAPE